MFLFVLIVLNFGIICLILVKLNHSYIVLLDLFMTLGISKYYKYSSKPELYKRLSLVAFVRLLRIGSVLTVYYYTDGFFNIKFHGVCVRKTNKGFGSSFVISARSGLKQRFFVFSPYLKKVIIHKV